MDKINLQVVREAFGRVVYSHKTHEKEVEIKHKKAVILKWFNLICNTLTFGGLIKLLSSFQQIYLIVTTILGALSLGVYIYGLVFNYEEESLKHKKIAESLWFIRECYENLIADIMNESIDQDLIICKRDQLARELKVIYGAAQKTSTEAYNKARKALKINEEFTFNNDEIDLFLPKDLKLNRADYDYHIGIDEIIPPIGDKIKYAAKVEYFYKKNKFDFGEVHGKTKEEAEGKMRNKVNKWIKENP